MALTLQEAIDQANELLAFEGMESSDQAGRIQKATTVAEVQSILSEVVSTEQAEATVTTPEYVDVATEESAFSDTPSEVQKVIDDVLASDDIDLNERQISGAYEVDTKEDAIQIIVAAIDAGDMDSRQALSDLYPDELAATRSNAGVFQGYVDNDQEKGILRASKEQLSLIYDGEFRDNHDTLVLEGWGVTFSDDDIFYINPDGNRVIDLGGDDVGRYSYFDGRIDFLEHLPDPRKPIGVETGGFIPEGTDINQIGGTRGTVSLKEWRDIYGDAMGVGYEDVVTRKTYEDILRNDLGVDPRLVGLFSSQSALSQVPVEAIISQYNEYEVPLHYQYLEGMGTNMLVDMPREEMASLQQRYSDLGVYNIGTLGLVDPFLLKAVNTTMAAANASRSASPVGFETSLDDFDASQEYTYNWFNNRPRGGGGGGGSSVARVWRPPAYLAPDYAELSQAVKATFEQKLGRAPSDAEIKMLSVKMGADHRGEFDAQAAAQKLQFFASGGTSAGTVQDVNYAARFQEDFGERYKDETDTLDKIGMSRNITQAALGSVLAADRAIGY